MSDNDIPEARLLSLTEAERDYWRTVSKADGSRGRIAVRVFCKVCGHAAATVYDSASGALYVCDVPLRRSYVIEGAEHVSDHIRRIGKETGKRAPWPIIKVRIAVEFPGVLADLDPDLDPEAVRAFCPNHPDVTLSLAELSTAVSRYRATGKPGTATAT